MSQHAAVTNSAALAVEFISLNRQLTIAETPAEWQPAAAAMLRFLDSLEGAIHSPEAAAAWDNADWAKLFSMLLTIMADAGQYRHESFAPSGEADRARRRLLDTELLPLMSSIRKRVIVVAKQFLTSALFAPLQADIQREIFPLLDSADADSAPDRFMPFRVIQAGNIVERLYGFRLRTNDARLTGAGSEPGLLRAIYDRKYLRFGTSGVRGRWGLDFTETRAKQVVQAICDFLKNENAPRYVGAENLAGKRIVIGYDSRKNAGLVAQWVAEVCLANGFTVDFANRDTPTPALVYYLTDYLAPDEVAGLINLTASHNPPEWQGIKFNPRLGYPAPTNQTDFIATRINELQLLDQPIPTMPMEEAEAQGRLRGFDCITHYVEWILAAGRDNARIPLDWERMRRYFADKRIIVDEMHGAGRGYLTRILGELGIRHTVLHAERDPHIPGLDYANPEEPFINELKAAVKASGADLGVGLDTDADRFGIVDRGGVYFRPNQILPMLVRYLGVDRGLQGRVIATQTGSPLIEVLAGKMQDNAANEPAAGVIPAYVDHPFYRLRLGKPADRVYQHTFLVPVGIKYIEEQRRTNHAYRGLKPLPNNWRDVILIGGEESSGLTTRGHVTDKDGVWANLLVMDMLAYYGTGAGGEKLDSIADIWKSTAALEGCWPCYGGSEWRGSNAGRVDVDAILEAKEELINYYLDLFADPAAARRTIAGLEVVYAGGIRYDVVEMQLRDETGDSRHYLRIRASGTEPINRVYVESSQPDIARRLHQTVIDTLEDQSIQQVQLAGSEWRLVDVLNATSLSPKIVAAVRATIAGRAGWSLGGIVARLERTLPELERRSQRVTQAWIEALSKGA